jgi:laminin, alpha 3/5
VDNNCDLNTGVCTCLPNIVGQKCDRPMRGYFIPSLYQLKYEIEDGYTNNKKQVRYGFDESVFPQFSWKGYVHLNKALVSLVAKKAINKRISIYTN